MTPAVGRLFRNRGLTLAGMIVGFLVLWWGAATLTEFSLTDGLASFPKAFGWLATNFVPTDRSLANLPRIGAKLGETLVVSVMATTLAGALAFVLALLGARPTRFHPGLSALVRGIASLGRNIPVVAWAMIFLLAFGQSYITGLLALFLESVGFLTRSFLEIIDETSSDSVEALRASGASWEAVVTQAVVPSVLPSLTSWLLFMLETNIRSATLVGLLTGTGIGFAFDLYYKSLNYPSAALVTLAIVVVVLVLEAASNGLRKVIL